MIRVGYAAAISLGAGWFCFWLGYLYRGWWESEKRREVRARIWRPRG